MSACKDLLRYMYKRSAELKEAGPLVGGVLPRVKMPAMPAGAGDLGRAALTGLGPVAGLVGQVGKAVTSAVPVKQPDWREQVRSTVPAAKKLKPAPGQEARPSMLTRLLTGVGGLYR